MRRWTRRLGYGIGGLAAVVVLPLAGVYGFSSQRLGRTFEMTKSESLTIPEDAATVARGRHIVEAITKCGECHAPDFGGQMFLNAGAMVGRVYAPNLTAGQGSVTSAFTVADWERAIRHGIAPGGRALKIMPSEDFI